MPLLRFLAVALCLSAAPAGASGYRFIAIPADAEGPAIHGAMWTPCAGAPGQAADGGIVPDCPISGDKLPLVVISHGNGGSIVSHHDTAETLADAGFVVAAISHPGNTALDMSHAEDLSESSSGPPTSSGSSISCSPCRRRRQTSILTHRLFWLLARRLYRSCLGRRRGRLGECDGPLPRLAAPYLRAGAQQGISGAFDARPADQGGGDRRPADRLFHGRELCRDQRADPAMGVGAGGDGVEPRKVAAVNENLPGAHEFHPVPNSVHFAFLAFCTPEWRLSARSCAPTRRASTGSRFTSSSMPMCSLYFRAHLVDH